MTDELAVQAARNFKASRVRALNDPLEDAFLAGVEFEKERAAKQFITLPDDFRFKGFTPSQLSEMVEHCLASGFVGRIVKAIPENET